MLSFILHIVLAVGLFYIINWVGRHSFSFGYMQLSVFEKTDDAPAFNFIFRIAAPLVYILLVSSILYTFNFDWIVQDIYRIVIYYFAFRYIFNISLGRAMLLNWKGELFISLSSITAAYLLYDKLISTKQRLIPDFNTISNELWIIILIFLYSVLNKVQVTSEGTEKRIKNYLRRAYNKYKYKYGSIIESKVEDRTLEALVYAIMIYESFNRPRIVRGVERLFFRLGKSKTLGIMQVTTNKRISDEESIELGIEKILNDYNLAYKNTVEGNPEWDDYSIRYEVLSETVRNYNPDYQYVSEVLTLHDSILNEFYAEEVKELQAQT